MIFMPAWVTLCTNKHFFAQMTNKNLFLICEWSFFVHVSEACDGLQVCGAQSIAFSGGFFLWEIALDGTGVALWPQFCCHRILLHCHHHHHPSPLQFISQKLNSWYHRHHHHHYQHHHHHHRHYIHHHHHHRCSAVHDWSIWLLASIQRKFNHRWLRCISSIPISAGNSVSFFRNQISII